MALTYRFYRSAEIDGLLPGSKRSSLAQYIVAGNGSDFWDWAHEIRPIRYAFSRADSTVHALCAADPGITPYSPELADLDAVHAWLDSPLSSVSQTIRDQLESDGFSTSWANAQTTRREAFRYISRMHRMLQELRRFENLDAMQLFNRGLDTTIGSMTVTQRNRLANWMQNRGLDTSWITGPTTIRAVIQYIYDNLNWPILQFGGPLTL